MSTSPSVHESAAIRDLRWVGIAEGVSFLVLLLIAVPLKHFLHMPLAVRVVGMIHGILFVIFVAAAIRATIAHGWKLRRLAFAVLMSVVPGGTFYLDAVLKRDADNEL